MAAATALSACPELANQNKSGLYVNSIERMMRLEDDQIDLATAALLLSRQAGAEINYKRYRRQIDEMACAVLDALAEQKIQPGYLGDSKTPDATFGVAAVKLINRHLFEQAGFKAVKTADDPKDLFLHYVLDRKRGYCLSLSIVYLSIGERLGLPLYGVVVPGHFFVKYDDGQTRFNIETTSQGNSAPDEHYLKKFDVPANYDDGIYMKNLTKKQTLSCFFNNLGNIYQSLDDIDSALILLERAAKITPELAMVHTNLGNIYLKKGWTQEAIDQYRAALRIHPDEAKTHNNLGNAYLEQGWLDEAISEYETSLKLDPNFADAYRNLARAYCKQELFEQAVAALKSALLLEPKDSGAHSRLGNVYRRMGNYGKAIINYNKALLLKPDSVEAYLGLGLTYNEMGDVDKEIKAYKQLLAIGGSSQYTLAALQNLGNAYVEKQMYATAIKQYQKAISIDPANALVRYNLGVAYVKQEDYNSAVAAYSAAVNLEPKLAEAHNGLAGCYYVLKEYDLAWKHLNTARRLGFDVAEDLYEVLSKKCGG